jgi:hypothetical protein
MPDEAFAALPFPGTPVFANMFAYFGKFPYYDQLRPLEGRAAASPIFRQWAEAHHEQLWAKLE